MNFAKNNHELHLLFDQIIADTFGKIFGAPWVQKNRPQKKIGSGSSLLETLTQRRQRHEELMRVIR